MPSCYHGEPHTDFRGHAVLWTAEDDPPSPANQGSSLQLWGPGEGGKRTPERQLLLFTGKFSVPGEYFLSMLGVMKLHFKKRGCSITGTCLYNRAETSASPCYRRKGRAATHHRKHLRHLPTTYENWRTVGPISSLWFPEIISKFLDERGILLST